MKTSAESTVNRLNHVLNRISRLNGRIGEFKHSDKDKK
jgi:hypothetical protein